MIPADACLLRVFVNANERRHGQPLYQAVVARARTLGLAGASVFPVALSYGERRRVHDAASDYSFADLPVVIDIIDGPERIAALQSDLALLDSEGLVTTSPVRRVRYGPRPRSGAQP